MKKIIWQLSFSLLVLIGCQKENVAPIMTYGTFEADGLTYQIPQAVLRFMGVAGNGDFGEYFLDFYSSNCIIDEESGFVTNILDTGQHVLFILYAAIEVEDRNGDGYIENDDVLDEDLQLPEGTYVTHGDSDMNSIIGCSFDLEYCKPYSTINNGYWWDSGTIKFKKVDDYFEITFSGKDLGGITLKGRYKNTLRVYR